MDPFIITFPGSQKVDIAYKSFTIHTDQSIENEGDETAPEPFELFLAALGSCAGIYAKSFCDAREISTRDMRLTLEATFKEGKKQMQGIQIVLYVNQAFPEKYIRAVIKSMDGCAVKNQLHPDIPVDTSVAYLSD